jgi:hypothetical protein
VEAPPDFAAVSAEARANTARHAPAERIAYVAQMADVLLEAAAEDAPLTLPALVTTLYLIHAELAALRRDVDSLRNE